MKTLILNGTTRPQGDTDALVRAFREAMAGDVLEVSAFSGNISPCVDCRYCWKHPGCALRDGMDAVYDYLSICDAVVLASPIWYAHLSGPLLSLASRFQTYFAARHFRGEPHPLGPKKGGVLLAGAQPHTAARALEMADILLGAVSARPRVFTVCSLRTNEGPASEDTETLSAARAAARSLAALIDGAG